jgi:hypothetical protein
MNMGKIGLAVCSAALMSGAASATSFTFTDLLGTQVVTGSFDGTLSGNLITNLSNISVFINGNPFNGNGSLYASSHNLVPPDWSSGGATASLDGTQNNFLFIDADYPNDNDFSNYYYSVYFLDNSGTSIGGTGTVQNFSATVVDDPSAAPEGASWAMMLGGFGLIGAVMRKRRSTVVSFSKAA